MAFGLIQQAREAMKRAPIPFQGVIPWEARRRGLRPALRQPLARRRARPDRTRSRRVSTSTSGPSSNTTTGAFARDAHWLRLGGNGRLHGGEPLRHRCTHCKPLAWATACKLAHQAAQLAYTAARAVLAGQQQARAAAVGHLRGQPAHTNGGVCFCRSHRAAAGAASAGRCLRQRCSGCGAGAWAATAALLGWGGLARAGPGPRLRYWPRRAAAALK